MNTIEPNNNDLQEGIKKLIDFFCKVHKETCVELSYYKYPRFIYNSSLKFEITAKRLCAASRRVL